VQKLLGEAPNRPKINQPAITTQPHHRIVSVGYRRLRKTVSA
jgi:hypothetical protein